MISTDHEYILAYQRGAFERFGGNEKTFAAYSNPDNDPRGDWTTGDLTVGMTREQRPNQFYDLIDPETGNIYHANPNRVWGYIPSTMQTLIDENRIVFPQGSSKKPMLKRFKNSLRSNINPISTWIRDASDKSIISDIPDADIEAPAEIIERRGDFYYVTVTVYDASTSCGMEANVKTTRKGISPSWQRMGLAL